MAKKNKQLSMFASIVLSFLVLIVGFGGGFACYGLVTLPKSDDLPSSLSIHFLELGNKYTGDCIFIKNGNTEIIVDAGSRTNSVNTIYDYVSEFCTDGIIEYAIVTHADQDHIASFAGDGTNPSLFTKFEFKTIIDFPKSDKTSAVYSKYKTSRDAEVALGAVHYTALECWNNQNGAKRVYDLGSGVELQVLYNYFYENKSSDENNYSVCFQIKQNNKYFLFTGDLEAKGEEYLVQNNTLTQVELFKAGHHGSYTASTNALLSVIKPKICVVTCVAGSSEYSSDPDTQFPSAAFKNRIKAYTSQVFVTSKVSAMAPYYASENGNVVVKSDGGEVSVKCSFSDTPIAL